ncbi:MAG: hypothetical protein ABWY06_04450 [Pseudomonas sp.]|uniref:hypothetical protein n=1 Tax=Pseudomonas sp. TaxID=306 RepID=UPI00339A05F9
MGIVLFGAGIGNASSLPPLMVRVKFPQQQRQRVDALIVALAQGCYAFAPGAFGLLSSSSLGLYSATRLFGLVAELQAAIGLLLLSSRGLRHGLSGT